MTSQNQDPAKSSMVSRTEATARIQGARLGGDAEDVLVANLDETVLLGCVGLAADDLDASDATIVSVVIDMSGSMSSHRRAVVDAFNTMQRALAGAKAASAILSSAWTFNDSVKLLSGFEPVGVKPALTTAVYRPDGGTALHDAVLAAMTGLVSYGQALWDSGVPTKRILFVLSDGEDNASRARAHEVAAAARALAREEAYTLAFAAFGTADHGSIARALGFTNVIAAAATESEIRAVFRQVSQSVIRVSQANHASSACGFF
jgi:Mg-chelatase subunit ChlD